VIGSTLLPWYGVPVGGGLSKTVFDDFGLAHLAMLITAAAVLVLIVRGSRGFVPPRPLGAGGLLVTGGVWMALLVVFLIADRPDAIAGSADVGIRIGPFVALGGAVAVVAGGLRVRRPPSAGGGD
jgi:hypothetical protein